MADLDLFQTINALSAEEEQLWASASDGSGLTQAQQERLDAIKVELDRARRARRPASIRRTLRSARPRPSRATSSKPYSVGRVADRVESIRLTSAYGAGRANK